jgi:hypothetical protein
MREGSDADYDNTGIHIKYRKDWVDIPLSELADYFRKIGGPRTINEKRLLEQVFPGEVFPERISLIDDIDDRIIYRTLDIADVIDDEELRLLEETFLKRALSNDDTIYHMFGMMNIRK